MNTSDAHPNIMHRLAEILDKPAAALVAAGGSTLLAAASELLGSVSPWVTDATAVLGLGTAFIVFLFWVRKFVIQALHDYAAFRKGKLPKVDSSEPK